MILRLSVATCLAFGVAPVIGQWQIYDIWATTWDRSSLFTYTNLSPNPINFVSPGAIGQADITIEETPLAQAMVGYGASLTDSSALILNNLKGQNSNNYWSILNTLFDPTDGADAAGFSYLRVPLGASDFSSSVYSFDDVAGDVTLANFNINKAPSYLFSVINDIRGINPYLKIHILPWSPPGWMKDSGTMLGGNFLSQYTSVYANYLLKCLQGFQSHGISVYAISIQNEPENSNPTYPTCKISADQEAQIGSALRTLMNSNGFSGVRLVGYEHNWDDAAGYPVQLMDDASASFAGVSFHCYAGNFTQQDSFHNAFPSKEIYFTECSGVYGTDWWTDIKWYMENIFIGSVTHSSKNGLMWNLALDGNGQPILPGTTSCGTPCRPVVQVNSDGTFMYHQEFYAMAQAGKAILPRDVNGPFGQRLHLTIGGSRAQGLIATAFVTGRVNPSDWQRYSLVVLNWDDRPDGTWNPTPIQTTIEFREMQATYTFPVGVTTLWWYAPSTSFDGTEAPEVPVANEEKQGAGGWKQMGAQKQKQEPFKAWVHTEVNGEAQRPVEVIFR